MRELTPTEAAIVACHDEPPKLDELEPPTGAIVARVAQDEIWLVGDRARRAELLAVARARLPGALVVDQTDGWSGWTLDRARGHEVLDRLMLAPVPRDAQGLVQGAIAGVAGKVIAGTGALHLLVPSPLGHHLRDRILAAGRDLGIRPGPAVRFASDSR